MTAIGWSLTGTMNSPSTSLAVLYPTDTNRESNPRHTSEPINPSIASILSSAPTTSSPTTRIKYESPHGMPSPSPNFSSGPSSQQFNPTHSTITTMPPPPSTFHTVPAADPVLVSEADLLLNLHSPFSASSSPGRIPTGASPYAPSHRSSTLNTQTTQQDFSTGPGPQFPQFNASPSGDSSAQVPFGDMMIESQDIDMSALGDDMMPWLEYLPHEMLNYYDTNAGFVGDGGVHGQGMGSADAVGGAGR